MALRSTIRSNTLTVMKTLQIVLGHTRRGEFKIVARYCAGLVSQVLGPGRRRNGRSAWLSSRFHESSKYDIEHGVDTSGTGGPGDDSEVHEAVAAHTGNYAPSRPSSFKLALSRLGELDFEDYTFVDLGSGKGRTLLLASEYRFNRIIGVEFSKALHEAALDNVRRYGKRSGESTRIECVCGDATTFALPADPLVIYLFDPFQGELLARVVVGECTGDAAGRWMGARAARGEELPRATRLGDELRGSIRRLSDAAVGRPATRPDSPSEYSAL